MKPWLRPLPFALFAGYALSQAGGPRGDDVAPNVSTALCAALARSNVTCAAEDVVWTFGASGLSGATVGQATALVRGREAQPKVTVADPGAPAGELNDTFDLFSVGARLSPEGQLLEVDYAHNLTRTSGADEGLPVLEGSLAAYVVSVDGRPEAVHVLDLAGHDTRAYEELSRFQRFQLGVADWQQTGQARGMKRSVFALVPPPARAELTFRPGGTLAITTEARTLLVIPARDLVTDGTAFVRVTPEVLAKPPTFGPWMSDRLRAVSWFGDEKNQILKVIAFTAIEWFKGAKTTVTGDTGEKDAQEDLDALNQGNGGSPPATFSDPEVGWPPKALEALIKPPLAGEGQWIALEKDAFITPIPGVPAPFLTTFVRGDPSALQTRVYVTLWDPRLVSLHMEAGTVEPVSATGEAGPGQIPQTPEVVRHVVAGFNGGFQATHGEFGMQANGVLYLPPKAYGATVMELRDGTTAFGAWPRAPQVPDEVLSFRQNMTPLVQNDKYNPWGRAWWGGVPPGWHDAIHTTRSGLCLTKENFVAYFWGNDIGPEPLGRAMLLARCAFGIHLDMNPGLAGFEFYNVQPATTFQALGRPLQADWEVEGTFKDLPEFKFRARRMVKSMGHMLFPRYLHREARDFFYLTSRAVLPGAPLTFPGDSDAKPSPVSNGANGATKASGDGDRGENGHWRVKGLPQHGYPYAIATTSLALGLEPDAKLVRVLRIDPRMVRADSAPTAGGSGATVVAVFGRAPVAVTRVAGVTRTTRGRDAGEAPRVVDTKKLWLGAHLFGIDKAAPVGTVALVEVAAAGSPLASEARVAVGVSDEDGMLHWVELPAEEKPDASSAERMMKLLAQAGCVSRGLVVGDVRAILGGSLDLAGQPATSPSPLARLLRTPGPTARPYFESTEVVPQSVWFPLQQQRVKWRPTLAPPSSPAPAASASGSAASAPAGRPTPVSSSAASAAAGRPTPK